MDGLVQQFQTAELCEHRAGSLPPNMSIRYPTTLLHYLYWLHVFSFSSKQSAKPSIWVLKLMEVGVGEGHNDRDLYKIAYPKSTFHDLTSEQGVKVAQLLEQIQEADPSYSKLNRTTRVFAYKAFPHVHAAAMLLSGHITKRVVDFFELERLLTCDHAFIRRETVKLIQQQSLASGH